MPHHAIPLQTTLLSRFFTIVFIVFGVVFFGNAAAQIQETRSTEASGMGSYLRKVSMACQHWL